MVSKWADKSQKGFCAGRQGSNNVIELDTNGRILSMLTKPAIPPLLLVWDFEAAFPSLAHPFGSSMDINGLYMDMHGNV